MLVFHQPHFNAKPLLSTMAPIYIPADKAQPLNSVGLIPIMVHVTAPADLPAGYTFEALLNGNPERTFTAVVVRTICAMQDNASHIRETLISLLRCFLSISLRVVSRRVKFFSPPFLTL